MDYIEMPEPNRKIPHDIRLNGQLMTDFAATTEYLIRKFELPDYYNGSLDSLWELIHLIHRPLHITLTHPDPLRQSLGNYGEQLIALFLAAADADPDLTFEVDDPS